MLRLLLTLCICLSGCLPALSASEGGIHAVIVSGGKNKLMNHERYWNDCAFLYCTLRYDYHLPKRNVLVLMSDGTDPANDQLLTDNRGFASSPTDLDGDGQSDINLAATTDNLVSVLSSLSHYLTTADHLFLFFIDHGDRDGDGNPFLWLWNNERFSNTTLALMLGQFSVASINIVAGQCYSGGFVANLEAPGRILTTACQADELSWICPDRNYDEFVYHWTCAIAGHDEHGTAVSADANGDGSVSMEEAFHYARHHDRRPETPLYSSVPIALGQRWTFSGMLPEHYDDIAVTRRDDDKAADITFDLLGRTATSRSHKGLTLRKGRKTIK